MVAVLAAGLASCANSQQGEQTMPTKSIEEVLKAHTDALMAIPGVVGTAQSLCDESKNAGFVLDDEDVLIVGHRSLCVVQRTGLVLQPTHFA